MWQGRRQRQLRMNMIMFFSLLYFHVLWVVSIMCDVMSSASISILSIKPNTENITSLMTFVGIEQVLMSLDETSVCKIWCNQGFHGANNLMVHQSTNFYGQSCHRTNWNRKRNDNKHGVEPVCCHCGKQGSLCQIALSWRRRKISSPKAVDAKSQCSKEVTNNECGCMVIAFTTRLPVLLKNIYWQQYNWAWAICQPLENQLGVASFLLC